MRTVAVPEHTAVGDFQSLLSSLSAPFCGAVEMVRLALLFARDHDNAFELALGDDAVLARCSDLKRAITALLTERPLTLDLSDAVRAAVVTEMKKATDGAAPGGDREMHEAFAAHATATVLEECFGFGFHDHLAAHGSRVLGPDDLIPFCSPFSAKGGRFRGAYGKNRLTPNPTSIGAKGPEQLTRVRLAPRVPHAANLHWVPRWDVLDDLQPESLICAILPGSYSELHQPEGEERNGMRYFFGVAPSNPAERTAAALKLVGDADRAGAHVIVLPEVCLTRDGVEQVASWVERSAENICVAVCGSCHDDSEDVRRNFTVIASPRESSSYERVRQSKIVPFVRRTGPDAHEDIRHGERSLHLISGRDWSLLALICMDFIDEKIEAFAQAVRATLVLVPACTATTGVFASTASTLATRAQAHVVIANQDVPSEPQTGAPSVCIIARPLREHHLVITEQIAPTGFAQGVLKTRLHGGSWSLE
jgi:hypothetical protein